MADLRKDAARRIKRAQFFYYKSKKLKSDIDTKPRKISGTRTDDRVGAREDMSGRKNDSGIIDNKGKKNQ